MDCDLLENLSKEDLLPHLKLLQQKLDEKNQKIYDYKRQLDVAKSVEIEYLEEIQLLKASHKKTIHHNDDLQEIKSLTEINLNLRERIGELEDCLKKKDEKVANLEQEQERLIQNDESVSKQMGQISEENLQMKEEIISASQNLEHLKQLQEINLALQEQINNLKYELDERGIILQCKSEELTETKDLLDNAKDELMVIQSELMQLRNKPQHKDERGNSLFKEVEDRRVKVEAKMKSLLQQTEKLNQQLEAKKKEAIFLRSELNFLRDSIKNHEKEKITDEENLEHSYRSQLRTFESLIEDYKKELAESKSTKAINDGTFLEKLLEQKKAEIQRLRDELKGESVGNGILCMELRDAHRDCHHLKVTISNLHTTKSELEDQIQALIDKLESQQNMSNIETTNGSNVTCEAFVSTNTFAENGSSTPKFANKEVRFASNVLEPAVTNRLQMKSGSKMIISKPRLIPSLKK